MSALIPLLCWQMLRVATLGGGLLIVWASLYSTLDKRKSMRNAQIRTLEKQILLLQRQNQVLQMEKTAYITDLQDTIDAITLREQCLFERCEKLELELESSNLEINHLKHANNEDDWMISKTPITVRSTSGDSSDTSDYSPCEQGCPINTDDVERLYQHFVSKASISTMLLQIDRQHISVDITITALIRFLNVKHQSNKSLIYTTLQTYCILIHKSIHCDNDQQTLLAILQDVCIGLNVSILDFEYILQCLYKLEIIDSLALVSWHANGGRVDVKMFWKPLVGQCVDWDDDTCLGMLNAPSLPPARKKVSFIS